MVGVAGRSKACHTCKQRKIRCGGEKPTCLKCAKSGRSCAGYQKSHAFILSQYATTSHTESMKHTLQPFQDDGSAPVLLARWRRDRAPKARSQAPISTEEVAPRRQKLHSRPCFPVSISSRNSFRDQFLALFLHEQCPPTIINPTQPGSHRNWLFSLASAASLSPALEHALLALTTARLGQQGENVALVHQSLPLYTRGLRELQRAIDNPVSQCDMQTIAACMVLGMYEFDKCPGRTTDGYMSHYHGAMLLLQLRGAEQHVEGLSHGVFQMLRMHAAFQGLRQRRATFLAQPDWIEKPWAGKPKNSNDLLLDLFLQVPDVIAKMDRSFSLPCSQDVFGSGLDVLQQCFALDKELDDWFSSYQAANAGYLYWPKLSTRDSVTDSTELGKLFPVSLHFPTYTVGETMILYWTVRVLLHTHICFLHRRLSIIESETVHNSEEEQITLEPPETGRVPNESGNIQRSSPNPPLAPLGHQEDWLQAPARSICQSVEYFLDEKLRSLGPGTILPPLLVVGACLSRSGVARDREAAWIAEVIQLIKTIGPSLAEFV
ncbi:hypothetical protein BGZ63DRAFT_269913 [Mariannaea sp. PMI_226]|nr:hypothetical protein BGZ63DRAFT_269913 [Mariannaea sp. PMI_226]